MRSCHRQPPVSATFTRLTWASLPPIELVTSSIRHEHDLCLLFDDLTIVLVDYSELDGGNPAIGSVYRDIAGYNLRSRSGKASEEHLRDQGESEEPDEGKSDLCRFVE